MTTATNIIDRVADIVQDFSEETILDYINMGIGVISMTVNLPALKSTAQITTTNSTNSAALPADYQRNMYWVGSQKQKTRIGSRIGDYHNLDTFLEMFPFLGQTGTITNVCVDGTTLLYHAQDNDVLTIKYYKNPTVITSPETQITSIPQHFVLPILTAFCCKELFAMIEDGMEGAKTNTTYWDSMFNAAIMALQASCRESSPREAKYIRDMTADY
jgi:hypothetical protein